MEKTLWVVECRHNDGSWLIHNDGEFESIFHCRQHAINCAKRYKRNNHRTRVVPFDRRAKRCET